MLARLLRGTLGWKWAGSPIRAHFLPEYYRAATTELTPVLRSHGYSAEEIGTHAGVADTSLTMAIAPGYVRQDGLKTGADLDAAHGVYAIRGAPVPRWEGWELRKSFGGPSRLSKQPLSADLARDGE